MYVLQQNLQGGEVSWKLHRPNIPRCYMPVECTLVFAPETGSSIPAAKRSCGVVQVQPQPCGRAGPVGGSMAACRI